MGGIPTLSFMILEPQATATIPGWQRWAGLTTNYALDLMIIAAWGHALIAIIRMMGYGIPRNTVNPMASRSLAEFWNRYYYYFKELLVDFFFTRPSFATSRSPQNCGSHSRPFAQRDWATSSTT